MVPSKAKTSGVEMEVKPGFCALTLTRTLTWSPHDTCATAHATHSHTRRSHAETRCVCARALLITHSVGLRRERRLHDLHRRDVGVRGLRHERSEGHGHGDVRVDNLTTPCLAEGALCRERERRRTIVEIVG
jgi:hypothetical protein